MTETVGLDLEASVIWVWADGMRKGTGGWRDQLSLPAPASCWQDETSLARAWDSPASLPWSRCFLAPLKQEGARHPGCADEQGGMHVVLGEAQGMLGSLNQRVNRQTWLCPHHMDRESPRPKHAVGQPSITSSYDSPT